jgi:predicted deacylase
LTAPEAIAITLSDCINVTPRRDFVRFYSLRRAKLSGLFHVAKANGAYVNKEEMLGAICNPYGQIEARIISPVDGYIIGINNQPVVNQGDALMHIGSED